MGSLIPWLCYVVLQGIVFFSHFNLQGPNISIVRADDVLGRNETDRLALLEFKSRITADPLGVLSSWNESVHFCQWFGVECSRRHQRVSILDLHSSKLAGSISPHIGNLSFLRELHLQNNSFTHEIPQEIGRLRRLQTLNLYNNSIGGEVPANLSGCSNLILVSLVYNNLVGEIPTELGSLLKLEFISLSANNLTGSIPSSFGNLSSLDTLSLSLNNLHGRIPEALGRLRKLMFLNLGGNMLSGTIPLSIFNLSSITTFDVGNNQIHGSIPSDIGITLPKLSIFGISFNEMTGQIPASISNASDLVEFQAAENRLTGEVPTLHNPQKLSWFIITGNSLGNEGNDDLNFLSSFTNATRLEMLFINGNKFGGILPEYVSNLSTTLVMLLVDNNQISGKIPSGIGKFINLQRLDMWSNHFTGTIPADIGKLQNLGILYLDGNRFIGNIPATIGSLKRLHQLDLSDNLLQGSIPSSLAECKSLTAVDLSNNNLSGTIPPQIFSLPSLSIFLDLSRNHLTGVLPMEIGNLKNLGGLDVSTNMFSGEIPSTIGSCIRMELLGMQDNIFQGSIPLSMRALRGLRALDLSQNNLSGEIPEFLASFDFLESLNLSYNNFEGTVPIGAVFENASATFVVGNNKLCGGIAELNLTKCSFEESKKRRLTLAVIVVISIVSGLLGVTLLLLLLFLFCVKKKRAEPESSNSKDSLLKVSYQKLHQATGGFCTSNRVGAGSFGTVYKGFLDQVGKEIAVKVLDLQNHGAFKSFVAECKALQNIRHRNLVKILTICSGVDYRGNDFKALVYEFMINGSLEEWLHPVLSTDLADDLQPKTLNLLQRLKIAIDVASAIDYLHQYCRPPIAHCDLKPSNVLLDADMTAHVGDFGLARFLPDRVHKQTSSFGLIGSVGYAAPEYGMGSEASTYGDVYSFGILLLEMLTGKRPTDEMFNGSLKIHNFAKEGLQKQVMEIVDPIVFQESEQPYSGKSKSSDNMITECLTSMFEVAVACSVETPRERMKINEALIELLSIKDRLS